ncbi:MAG: UDP-2,3-diacylglucosamine diphosphatase [Rikenellaceae bacterium]
MHYFISDVHLGAGDKEQSRQVELRLVEWLKSIEEDAQTLFICGDLFDFWFEYKYVVPKGFTRTLAMLTHLRERGVRVIFMTGNHDQWVGEYLCDECGVDIYTTPQAFTVAGKRLHVAHGDNLGVKKDPILKLINKTFHSKTIRRLFASIVHPDLAMKFGHWWSRKSRLAHQKSNYSNGDRARDYLIEWASNRYKTEPFDCFIFGHLHQTLDYKREDGLRVMFTNDWSQNPHCIAIDNQGNINLKEI